MKYLFLILYRLSFLLPALGIYAFFCGLVYIWEEMEYILRDKILYTLGLILALFIIMSLWALCAALCKAKYESISEVE